MSNNGKVKVIPCSGMGKVYGLIAREAVLKTVQENCPDNSETVCLAYIVTGDEEIQQIVKGQPCITIDGCPLMCSAKSVEIMGGDIQEKFRVLDAVKEHKGAKPGTATVLAEDGWMIADELADKMAVRIGEICTGKGSL